MSKVWRDASRVFTIGFIGAPTGRSRHGESTSRNRMAGNGQTMKRVQGPDLSVISRKVGQALVRIAALEDKIVQQAVVTVLQQIYEEDFIGFSYGFRPARGAQDALDALSAGIITKKVNWILDAGR
jgi:hypothetical protein